MNAHNDTNGAELQPDDDLACLRGCRNAAPFALVLWLLICGGMAWWLA